MKQTIEIEVPAGKEAVWKDGKVYFIDKQLEPPKTWEEFCKNYPIKKKEYYISNSSSVTEYTGSGCRLPNLDCNLLPSSNATKAHLALMKLHQLRDCYRQGWEPNWKDNNTVKYCIANCEDLFITNYATYVRFLSFQSKEIAEEFLDNFRDLIKEAEDLI